MVRFIALGWNAANKDQDGACQRLVDRLQRSASTWRCAVDNPGFRVYITSPGERSSIPCQLSDGSGVLIGTVFKAVSSGLISGALRSISQEDTNHVISTSGRHLLRNYWGRYAAIRSCHFVWDFEMSG